MRAKPQPSRANKSAPISISSPVGGWNTRDALEAMGSSDAITLDNWFPGLGSCRIRGGAIAYADTLGGTVKTLIEFNAKGTRKFLAAANGHIWNISSSGAGVSLASGFTQDYWQWAQFDDASGGARTGLVNGSDAPQYYDGTAVAAMTISGTGLTVANLNGICIHKSRSYFWDNRTQDFWYSAVNALGGTLTKFPLGRVTNGGGNLIGMASWSRDSGAGLLDTAAFVLSSGDVIVYSGDNPGDSANWGLIGRYTIGAPIATRAIKKIGGNILIVTKSGYLPLSRMLADGRVNEDQQSISSKIRGAAISAVNANAGNNGWDITYYPKAAQIIVNVPISTTLFHQHVMNSETGAWCRFIGQPSQCWGLFNDALYYGTASGTVLLADSGSSDNGTAIIANAQGAYSYLGLKNRSKRISGLRFTLRSTDGQLTYNAGVGYDYEANPRTSIVRTVAGVSNSSSWDTSDWDVAFWSDESITRANWDTTRGSGFAVSPLLQITTSSLNVDWYSTDFLAEPGSIL